MSDDTSTGARSARGDRGEPLAELGLPLEELVRRGAHDILPVSYTHLTLPTSDLV